MHHDLYRVISVTILVAIAVVLAVRRYGATDRFEGFQPVAIDRWSDRASPLEGFQPVAIDRWSDRASPLSCMSMQQHLVIRDAATWAHVWSQIACHHGETRPAAPAVDFARQVVIVAALGLRSGGGYSIDITEVRIGHGDAVVFLEERDPGPYPTTAVETEPVTYAIVPSFPGLAMFVDHPVVR
jgi:hypothetical protein